MAEMQNTELRLRLTLVRHGVTEWNTLGRWQGFSDTPLSDTGRAQAQQLQPRLARQDFDLVYSSDLQRAADTARLAGLQPILEPRLREIHFGQLEGTTNRELQNNPDLAVGLGQWRKNPLTTRLPNGESYSDMLERVLDWLKDLPASGNVIAFSHSGVIKTLVPHLLGTSAFVGPETGLLWWRFLCDHTSVTVLERWTVHGHTLWSLYGFNDTGHLLTEGSNTEGKLASPNV
jgi:broad specificity phosphatase PhoE